MNCILDVVYYAQTLADLFLIEYQCPWTVSSAHPSHRVWSYSNNR